VNLGIFIDCGLGIIPIVYENVEYNGVENQQQVRDRVLELNALQRKQL
jgi:hypothetical protein